MSCVFCNFNNLNTVNRQQLIKHVAREAQDPSRKMRLEKSVLNHNLKSIYDLYGASCGRFTETHGSEAEAISNTCPEA